MESIDKQHLLRQLQETDFVLIELMEYLDTHPYDREALERYNLSSNKSSEYRKLFDENFSPLRQGSPNRDVDTWLWGETDFPWDD